MRRRPRPTCLPISSSCVRAARLNPGMLMAKKTAKLQRKIQKTAVKSKPRHTFSVKHERAEDFDAGLRTYAKYRDLELAKATTGMVQAHVIQMVPPCDPKVVSKWHYHDVNLQFIYVLNGWIK